MAIATSSEYFSFVLLSDGSYGIKAKDVNSMPKKVIIPTEYQGRLVTEILDRAFFECENLIELIITNSIKVVRKDAFGYCCNLETVKIGFGVVCIDKLAFADCECLESIQIGENVRKIGECAFYNSGLSIVDIPASTEEIERCAFSNCDALTNIVVNKENKKYNSIQGNLYSKDGETLIQYAIGKMETTFIIPNSVTRISEFAFACSDLERVVVPDSVKFIECGAFDECYYLKIFCQVNNQPNGWDVHWNQSDCPVIWGDIDCYDDAIVIDDVLYKIKNGFASVKGVVNSAKEINIWAIIEYEDEDYEVLEIENQAFYGSEGINSITINNGILKIGDQAFSNCNNLVSVIIPSSVKTIGRGAFSHCSKLEKIIVKKGNKNYKDIDGVLYNNDGSVLIYHPNTSWSLKISNHVTEIEHAAFAGCDKLSNIQIPESVMMIDSRAFIDCSNLVNITVSVNNENYKDIDGNLYDKEGSTLIRYAQNKASSLFVVSEQTTKIDSCAFWGCANLDTIKLPSGLREIGDFAFYSCKSLKHIEIPRGVMKIGAKAFKDCASLTICCQSVNELNGWGDDWCDCNQQVFWGVKHFSSTDEFDYYITINNEAIITKYKGVGGDVVIPKELEGAIVIGFGRAFYLNKNITTVEISEGVLKIDESAFEGCFLLTNVVIPSSVDSIGHRAFHSCYSLSSVIIPSGVKEICERTFEYCKALKSISIPNTVTTIGKYAFYDCRSLTEMNIPDSVTSIGCRAFYCCGSLSSVIIPSGVKEICEYTFTYCKALKSVSIPNTVTTIGKYAFYDCWSLTEINIPDSVCIIGGYAFCGCNNLSSLIIIPNGVNEIGDFAFYSCTPPSGIVISKSVTTIGYKAFSRGKSKSTTTYCEAKDKPKGWDDSWKTSKQRVVWNSSFDFMNKNNVVVNDKVISYNNTANNNIQANDVAPNNIPAIDEPTILCKKNNNIDVEDSFFDGKESVKEENDIISTVDYDYYITKNKEAVIVNYKGIGGDVIIPNYFDDIPIIDFGQVFRENKNITSIQLSNGITEIKEKAFEGCKSLKRVILSDNIKLIGSRAFYGCSSITNIKIPKSVTAIGDWAFNGNISLKNIKIFNNITSIGSYAFNMCTALTCIVIPNNLTFIGNYAFRNCINLDIFCEVKSKLDGWGGLWNYSKRPVYWYSEQKPVTAGLFWHYGDGEIKIW